MLVELIGPAGAGKTSAARAAEDILKKRGVDVLGFDELERLESEIGTRSFRKVDVPVRRRTIAALAARHPDIVLPILLLSRLAGPEQSTGSRKRRQRRARRAIGHLRLALMLRAMPQGRVVLLHEGFTQVLWTLLIDSPSLRARWLIRFLLARYHAAVGQKAVAITVDQATVAQRAFSRDSKGRFSRESSDRQRRDFPIWLEVHRVLLGLLPKGLIEVRIDGHRPCDLVASDLADAVEIFLGAAARPAVAPPGAVPLRSM